MPRFSAKLPLSQNIDPDGKGANRKKRVNVHIDTFFSVKCFSKSKQLFIFVAE